MSHLNKRIFLAVVISISVLIMGFMKSFEIFERFCSLIIVIAIIFFAFDARNFLEKEAIRSFEDRLKKMSQRPVATGSVNEMRKFIDIASLSPDENAALDSAWKANFAYLILVIIGTIVWGWGSLLGHL